MIHHAKDITVSRSNERGRRFAAMMDLRVLSLIALCILLAGCASTPKLDSDAEHLAAVRIDPAIDTQKDMYYLGPGSGIGMMFGAVGGLATGLANLGPGERLKKFSEDNGIHIDQIVREEATQAFRQSGKLNLTDEQPPGVATLKISVPMWGFSIPTGFSSELVPVLKIECALIGPDGKTIWSANDSVLPLGNPAEGQTSEALKANPKLIEEAWRIAAKTIMTNIASHM